jgi:hypothetical protein
MTVLSCQPRLTVATVRKEKQQALEAWERKLTSIITATECNVIPIKRKAA